MRPGEPGQLRGVRVLVIEDEPAIRDLFSTLLRYEGADVVSAGDGREALDIARRHGFDVVLTDLGLPDIPGDVLIRQLLATSRQRPRVVVVTGFGEPFQGRALAAGADAVLAKPVDWSSVLAGMAAESVELVA